MATINFNNGDVTDIKINGKYDKTNLYLSAEITIANTSIKIAGHSIINLDGKASIEDVQFHNHLLDYSFNLYTKLLVVIVDVSKFKIEEKDLEESDQVATCKLKIEAGDDLINEYSIDDSSKIKSNSVFNFLFTFLKA